MTAKPKFELAAGAPQWAKQRADMISFNHDSLTVQFTDINST